MRGWELLYTREGEEANAKAEGGLSEILGVGVKHLGWVVLLCAHLATQMLHPYNPGHTQREGRRMKALSSFRRILCAL